MKIAKRKAFRDFLVGLPINAALALLTYWLTGRWDLTLVVALLVFAGVLNNAYGTYLVWKRKKNEDL